MGDRGDRVWVIGVRVGYIGLCGVGDRGEYG